MTTFIRPSFCVDVDPSRIEVTVSPGTEQKLSLTLSNRTNQIFVLSAASGKYRFLLSQNSIPPEGKKPDECLNSCESWISLELNKLIVNPAEKRNFSFTVKVPSNAKGEYAACILFDQEVSTETETGSVKKSETENESKEPENDISVNLEMVYRHAIPVYLFIKDTTEIAGEITAVAMDNMKTNAMGTPIIKFSTTIKNTGTKHIRSSGTLVIFDKNGTPLETIPTGKTLPVFPGFSETIPVFWSFTEKESVEKIPKSIALKKFIANHIDKFTYDESIQSLKYKGVMSASSLNEYLDKKLKEPLSEAEKEALKNLFKKSQPQADTYLAVLTLDIGEDKMLQAEKRFSVNEKGSLVK